MSDAKKAVLNLDEFFGQTEPVKVRWNKAEYELKRPEAMGPVELVKFSKLHQRITALNGVREELTETEARELRALAADMLTTICPELGNAGLPFMAQMRVVTFYAEQIQGDEKKVTAPETPPPAATHLAAKE